MPLAERNSGVHEPGAIWGVQREWDCQGAGDPGGRCVQLWSADVGGHLGGEALKDVFSSKDQVAQLPQTLLVLRG